VVASKFSNNNCIVTPAPPPSKEENEVNEKAISIVFWILINIYEGLLIESLLAFILHSAGRRAVGKPSYAMFKVIPHFGVILGRIPLDAIRSHEKNSFLMFSSIGDDCSRNTFHKSDDGT